METLVMEKIIKYNSGIQHMAPENGPADIQKAYAQLQKLFGQLRQADGDHPGYLIAWNLLTHYGETELQDVRFYYAYTKCDVPSPIAWLNYEKAFTRLKELIDMAVAVLHRK